MPIMAIYRSSGVDPDTFDRFRVEVPIEPLPEGAISHHVAFDGDDLLDIDVWESQAHLDAFARDRLNPGLRRLGLPIEAPQILELHALMIVHGADRYNLAAATPQPA